MWTLSRNFTGYKRCAYSLLADCIDRIAALLFHAAFGLAGALHMSGAKRRGSLIQTLDHARLTKWLDGWPGLANEIQRLAFAGGHHFRQRRVGSLFSNANSTMEMVDSALADNCRCRTCPLAAIHDFAR